METNRWILRIGITAILITLALCLGISFYLKLEEPVFLENYSEYTVSSYGNSPEEEDVYQAEEGGAYQRFDFIIQYVTNVTDQRTVIDVQFPEEPDFLTQVSNYDGNQYFAWPDSILFGEDTTLLGAIYGRYSVRTVYVTITYDKRDSSGPLVLTKAIVGYNNGDSQDISLGEMFLQSEAGQESCLEGRRSSSSSDGSTAKTFYVEKDITLMKVDSPLLESADGLFSLKINDIDYTEIAGLNLKAGDSMRIDSLFKIPEGDMMYNQYGLLPVIHYQDSEGNSYAERIYNIDYVPYYHSLFTFTGIVKYLHSRGVL